jgi:2-polyprenyl-3-methyl-5-hydroxy-6-metoxy-1,4-benzoquinol methylase
MAAAAHCEASDVIDPEEYARWREPYLGALTEHIEVDAIFRLAGDLGGKRVLDLACGDGTYSIAAFQRRARVIGVDISDAVLDSARRRAAACGGHTVSETESIVNRRAELGEWESVSAARLVGGGKETR